MRLPYKKTGALANNNIVFESKTMSYAGTTSTTWRRKDGRTTKLNELTYEGLNKMINEMDNDAGGFNLDFEIGLNSAMDENYSLLTIAHELFLHVDPKMEKLDNAIVGFLRGELLSDGGDEMMGFLNSLNKIGDTKGEHKLAIDGKSATMEQFVDALDEISGSFYFRDQYEAWKKDQEDEK